MEEDEGEDEFGGNSGTIWWELGNFFLLNNSTILTLKYSIFMVNY